ncbi:MAG: hypothetical protein JW768_12210 [Chitinispirillaceae bacterium]|nr:hypothetical protein [Chitinispirillaceae bacterium]
MQSITSITGLKNAIKLLEVDQVINGWRLKEQFNLFRESLKPVNLIKSTLKDVALSPYWIKNLLGAVMGLAAWYFSKNIIIGAPGKIFRIFFGPVMQFGGTNAVAQHPDAIKTFSQFIYHKIFRRKRNEF